MKSFSPLLVRRREMPFESAVGLLLIGLALVAPCVSRAQLVADGETNILDGLATNVPGNLVIGTNGCFTLLALTNGATLTNTGSAVIGTNATASSNSVVVVGVGSIWQCARGITVGARGSFNTLLVNGGIVTNDFCYVGNDVNSSNNSVTVTGAGSLFASQQGIVVGRFGPSHKFTVSNGGKVWAGINDSDIGGQGGGIGYASVTLTGTGSQWRGQSQLLVGYMLSLSNRLVVADGARMENSSCMIYGSGNSLLITDSGSLFTNISVSIPGSFNHLAISNGGAMTGFATSIGANNSSSGKSNVMVVSGAGSACTNSQDLSMNGSFNQISVDNGGTIASRSGHIGTDNHLPTFPLPHHNTCIVSDAGSLWLNQSNLWIGHAGTFNQLIVSNGALVVNENGYLGGTIGFSRSNTAIITGSGSAWVNRHELQVGNADSFQQLLITNGGTLTASNLYLGFSNSSVSNRVQLDDGNLMVTSPSHTSTTEVRRGKVVLNSGLFQTDFLEATNGVSSQIQFNGGRLRTRGTAVANEAAFVVGDGSRGATVELLGSGNHSFADGLTISSNAVLIGNGTIAGDVSIADGGTVSPGSSIGQLAINGNLMLSNGSRTLIEINAIAQTNDNFAGLTSVVYAGTLILTNLAGTLSNGSAFRLFTAGDYSGAFNGVSPSIPDVGLKWNLNRLPVDGTLRVLSVPTPPPVIAKTALSDGELLVRVTAGVPYDPVYLLTSTNVAASGSNWVVWTTNYFDAGGNTTFTNALMSDEPERYFRLRVE